MSLGASEEWFCRCKRNFSVPDGYRDVNYEADICFDACSGFLHEQLSFNDLPSGVSILTISGGAMHRAVQGGAV